MYSEKVGRHYVYGYNRQQTRPNNCPEKRTCEEFYEGVCQWKSEEDVREKKEIAMQYGISGESPLWRLYHLYGFNLACDLVFDVMYICGLNIFKSYIHNFFEWVARHEDVNMEQRVRDICLKVERARPHEMKQGRWPLNPCDFYKTFMAEENQKFIQWVLPFLLNMLANELSGALYKIGAVLVDIAHYIFNHTRVKGWTRNDINTIRQLFVYWRLMTEDAYGPNGKPLEHVAGTGHILDDVERFGHSDVFWCFSFEREVQKYQNIPTNQQNMKLSFIKYYSQKQFQEVEKNIEVERDRLESSERALLRVHEYLEAREIIIDPHDQVICEEGHRKCLLYTSSIDAAKSLNTLLEAASESICASTARMKGILIGSNLRKKTLVDPGDEVATYLQTIFQKGDGWRPLVYKQKFQCLLNGVLYRVNDDVVIRAEELGQTPFAGKIKELISLNFRGSYHVYFAANYYHHYQEYRHRMLVDQVDRHTSMNMIHTFRMFQYNHECIKPINHLLHKFINVGPASQDQNINI